MDPAVNQNQTQTTPVQPQQVATPASSVQKEQEPAVASQPEAIEHITTEVEIPPEVEKVGVRKLAETVELPPDVKKLGVTPSGHAAPVTSTTVLPQVTLPISDQQVVVGLHVQVISALRWLAEWCIRRLKKAHIALKVIHGKVMRVRN